MLSYQPVLAKKLFVFDEERGELKPLMGRVNTPIPLADSTVTALPSAPSSTVLLDPTPSICSETVATVAVPSAASQDAAPGSNTLTAASASVHDATDDEDAELLDIFLEEAREVIGNGQAAVTALASDPTNLADLTTLRRAFHTLKGSSRMVGLNTFGEAGWSLRANAQCLAG